MSAVQLLLAEHAAIRGVLAQIDGWLEPFDEAAVRRLLEFVDVVVVQVQHGKEEMALQQLTLYGSALDRETVGVLRREHRMVKRQLLRGREAMDAAFDRTRDERVAINLRACRDLLRVHLEKVERVLAPRIEGQVRDADGSLVAALRGIEAEVDAARLEALLALGSAPAERATIQGEGLLQGAQSEALTDPGRSARVVGARALGTRGGQKNTSLRSVGRVLYESEDHHVLLLHDFSRGLSVQANQFLIVHGDRGMLLDPGGPKIYPNLSKEVAANLAGGKLESIFLSHQDPDICTALNSWLMDTEAEAWVSKLWMRFLPHFGIDKLLTERLRPIPDEGMKLPVGAADVWLLPAHFLHSCGNFQVYDPISKILFSGDLGGSIGTESLEVTDLESHERFMLGFHRRYMASRAAMSAWADMVRPMDIEMIAPQHGALFRGPDICAEFIEWCADLECGVDLMQIALPPGCEP